MIKKKHLVFTWVVILSLLLSVPVVWAATRTVNGGFESNVTGWDGTSPPPQGAVVSHTSSPTYDSSAGAAQLQNTSTEGGFLGRVGQCVSLSAPVADHFVVRGRIYVPSSVTNFNRALIQVQFFTGPGCAPSLGFLPTPAVTATMVTYDDWNTLQMVIPLTQTVGAQTVADAASAAVYLHTHKTNSAPMTVYWDDVLFSDSTPTAVSLQSFTAQSDSHRGGLGWSDGGELTAVPLFIALSLILALITLLWLRR
jgi:hypothetical protein